jgi:dUTP pyrophosphatase
MTPKIKVQRMRPSSMLLPRYQSAHAAGMDLVADIEVSLEVASMGRVAVPTGIAVEIASGFEGQVRPRSGRALEEGLTLINSPGTIDADYRGEIKVLLVNLGSAPIVVRPGDRIAQLVIAPVARAELIEVAELGPSSRGGGGFGHTGR